MKTSEIIKFSTKGTPYTAWNYIPERNQISLNTEYFDVWLAGTKKSESWYIKALYEGGQPMWPNDGAEIINPRTGAVRYVEFDQIMVHPNVFKRKRKKSHSNEVGTINSTKKSSSIKKKVSGLKRKKTTTVTKKIKSKK